MQAQIAQLRATMALPGVPADEIAIYKTTIARIQSEIDARSAKAAPVTSAPTPPTIQPIKHTAPPPPQSFKIPSSDGMEEATDGVAKPRIIAPGKPDNLTPQQRTDLQNTHISAHLFATPPTVTIEWPEWDWGRRVYTERYARAAFATALRDLTENKRSRQGRLDHLPQYLAWWRAIQYYRALIAFWGAAPSRQQLELNRRDERYIVIFNMIVEKAIEHQII